MVFKSEKFPLTKANSSTWILVFSISPPIHSGRIDDSAPLTNKSFSPKKKNEHLKNCIRYNIQFSSVQSLSHVRLLRSHKSQHARHPVHHQLPEFTQTHVHRISDAIQPSHPLSSPSPPAPNPSQHQSLFQWSTLRMRWSFSFSIIPSKNTQDWSPLEWTGWISLQSKGLPRVFSNHTVQKHQVVGTQPSSHSNSHIHTWPLEKP